MASITIRNLDNGVKTRLRVRAAKIWIRRISLYYLLKCLGLNTDPSVRRPQNQQIAFLDHAQLGQSGEPLSGCN